MKPKNSPAVLTIVLLSACLCSPCLAVENVVVEIVDDTLLILGDTVVVTGDDTQQILIVEDSPWPGSKLIAEVAWSDFSGIEIITGGGDDFRVAGRAIPCSVLVSTGAGRDWVGNSLFPIRGVIDGDLTVLTGLGGDNVVIGAVSVNGTVDISTGNGSDQITFAVEIDNGTGIRTGLWVSRDLCVNTGVNVDYLTFTARVMVGADQGNAHIALGQGNDGLSINAGSLFAPLPCLIVANGFAFFDAGQGNDRVSAEAIYSWFAASEGVFVNGI